VRGKNYLTYDLVVTTTTSSL